MKIFLSITATNCKFWSLNVAGFYHRSLSHPAVIYDNGNKYYYLHGLKI